MSYNNIILELDSGQWTVYHKNTNNITILTIKIL